ncbi:MAG: hypothetical protein ACD_62C00485G0001, partial [uncultured bacterium]
GDVNADGYDDVIFGVQYDDDETTSSDRTGAAYLVSGSATRYSGSYELGSYSSTSANYTAKLVGDDDYGYAGTSVASAGDVNADGYDDLLVSATKRDTLTGAVYLLYGPVSGLIELADVGGTVSGVVIEGDSTYAYMGSVVAGIGDFDYDGDDDFVVTAPKSYSASGVGHAYFIYGEPTAVEEAPLLSSLRTVVDFDGDGKEDVLFRGSTSNRIRLWLMNGPTITTSSYLSDLFQSTDYEYVGLGDFDGDAKTDILWRDLTTGELEIWFMSGITVASAATVSDVRDLSYALLQISDMNADGKTDILWEDSTGALDVWFMDGTTISSTLTFGVPASGLTLKGTGDFNADGYVDLLLLNETTSFMTIMRKFSSTIVSTTFTPYLGTDFTIVGLGDFNADGKADIVSRRTVFTPTAATRHGEIQLWFMNGASLSAKGYFGTLALPWSLAGIGDFDKDGTDDLFFRNTITQEQRMWEINSSTSRLLHIIAPVAYPNAADIITEKLADFDGDGDVDILMRDPLTFVVYNWQYENYSRTSVGYNGTTPMLTLFDMVD